MKPNFVCRENLSAPGAGGFMYIAHFNYENNNSTPVYIPVGPKNSTSGAAHLATGQPVLFLPGGGTWAVPFNNVGQLTWQITSNKNNGTTGSIPANTSNVVCPSNFHSPIFLPADTSMIGQEAGMDIRVYPNPSTGNVFLEFTEGQAATASFEVYNYLGAKCAVNTRRASDQLVELDLSSFGKGLYVITVIQGDDRESRTVIIE